MGAKQSNTIIIKEDEIIDEIQVDSPASSPKTDVQDVSRMVVFGSSDASGAIMTIFQDQTPIDVSGVLQTSTVNHVPIVDTVGCGCMTTKSLSDIDQRESRGICHCGNQCTCVHPCECKPVKSRWFSGTKETVDIQDRFDRIHAQLNDMDKRIVVLEKLSKEMTNSLL